MSGHDKRRIVSAIGDFLGGHRRVPNEAGFPRDRKTALGIMADLRIPSRGPVLVRGDVWTEYAMRMAADAIRHGALELAAEQRVLRHLKIIRVMLEAQRLCTCLRRHLAVELGYQRA